MNTLLPVIIVILGVSVGCGIDTSVRLDASPGPRSTVSLASTGEEWVIEIQADITRYDALKGLPRRRARKSGSAVQARTRKYLSVAVARSMSSTVCH